MPEPIWHPVRVPPLRSDIDVHLRASRQIVKRAQRLRDLVDLFAVFALVGTAAGGITALFTTGVYS